jgi:NAD(P)-dependent dehydrogenase (short-subunit alcohol dehydrogenase family)
MNRIIVLTGAASGIGRATAEELKSAGHRVIGVDLHDTDVIADLASPAGRAAMARGVAALAPDGIDGVVAAAGVSIKLPASMAVAVNYFGAVASLELLRPLLLRAANPCAVGILSTAALTNYDETLVDLCLSSDEAEAKARADELDPTVGIGYSSSKQALGRWLRKAAISAEWAGSGILMNAVSPGCVLTPMTKALIESEVGRAMLAKETPIALTDRSFGTVDELAEVIAFLATLSGRFLVGQILHVDGGTEAIKRPCMV